MKMQRRKPLIFAKVLEKYNIAFDTKQSNDAKTIYGSFWKVVKTQIGLQKLQ